MVHSFQQEPFETAMFVAKTKDLWKSRWILFTFLSNLRAQKLIVKDPCGQTIAYALLSGHIRKSLDQTTIISF